MHFKSVTLRNFLSFGPEAEEIPLGKLNVIIGTNGSGKSNLIEGFELLRNVPGHPRQVIREGGAVRDWIWKGEGNTETAKVACSLYLNKAMPDLQYEMAFEEVGHRFEITNEQLRSHDMHTLAPPTPFFSYQNGHVMLLDQGMPKQLDPQRSIIALRRDPDHYPEVAAVGDFLEKVRVYREWTFGRNSPVRKEQSSDLPSHWLEPDCSNLGMVLSAIRMNPDAKEQVLKGLQDLYPGIEDFDVQIDPGLVQVYLIEDRKQILATRLSDGALRYLCLLSVIYHPFPPPVVCIESPELGLHPDVIVQLADHLKSAAECFQLIMTTHSEMLVNCFSDQPEAVLVCERDAGGTYLQRLDREEMEPWLERYRLGEYWLAGGLGGVRW